MNLDIRTSNFNAVFNSYYNYASSLSYFEKTYLRDLDDEDNKDSLYDFGDGVKYDFEKFENVFNKVRVARAVFHRAVDDLKPTDLGMFAHVENRETTCRRIADIQNRFQKIEEELTKRFYAAENFFQDRMLYMLETYTEYAGHNAKKSARDDTEHVFFDPCMN